MIRVCIEVRSGAAFFRLGIQAPSIRRAVSLAEGLYSASDVRVIFPIDPECFFIADSSAYEVLIERGLSQEEEQLA